MQDANFDIVLKFESEFVLWLWLGSIVFLSAPATATIICIQLKTWKSSTFNMFELL